MSSDQKLLALMPLIRLAGEMTLQLPPDQRADVLEGIAIITNGLDSEISTHAAAAAQALRDADAHQLTFAALLRQSIPTTPRP